MRKVFMLPNPTIASKDTSNSIHAIVLHLQKHLPAFGWEITEDKNEADLIAGHAGQTDGQTPVDVAHCHGLMPTFEYPDHGVSFVINAHVIKNLRDAKAITVPSQWVADILRRDMHINPHVVGWAIEPDEWTAGENGDFVLWAKTRPDEVCTPQPLNELALRVPNQRFITTFGDKRPNVEVIGRQTFDKMKTYIQRAAVYLSTTKETWGIATVEAMACGVPVLAYDWGGNSDIVEHKVTGYLVKPGNIDGLVEGLEYCLQHREELGAAAKEAARAYTWDKVARQFAAIYDSVLQPITRPKVSVVILSHNYGQYLPAAIDSVKGQKTSFDVEIIGVDNGSTDNTPDILDAAGITVLHRQNDGPAGGRNAGIAAAHGEYITCLDADDQLGNENFLQVLADALDKDRTLGMVFTGLLPIDEQNHILNISGWPDGYDYEQQLLKHNQVPTCNLFRRAAWERAGGYRSRFAPAEDAELWLRMGSIGFRAAQVVKEGWFIYRMHDKSLSASVRRNPQLEPNWLLYHPWIKSGLRPFAADGKPEKMSWPVKNYDNPDVAVIVPVGAGHETIVTEALDSIEGQTFWNWECVLVNDTGADLNLTAYPWAREVKTTGGVGAGKARNLGVKASKAPLVTFLDADDVFDVTFLEKTIAAFKRTGKYIYTDWHSLTKDGQLEIHACPEYDPVTLFRQTSIHSVNVLIPRVWFDEIGGFDEEMQAWEDVDFFMKLAAAGICGHRVHEPLFIYRYQQGKRREFGETVKADLKAFLYARYQDYITGKTMCGCVEKAKRKTPTVQAAANGNGTGEMIRVQYDGDGVPMAATQLKGVATKQNYGMRRKGDVFMVWKADFAAMEDRLRPYLEFEIPR